MTPNDRDTDESGETNGSGIVRTILTDLFETIADMDSENQRQRTATGSARRGDSQFDYGFTVGIGPGADHGKTREISSGVDTDRAATVHETDDGAVVTLDLPDINPTGLSAGVDSAARTLVVAAENEVIERVPLSEGDLEVSDASFNNGILDVRLRENTNE